MTSTPLWGEARAAAFGAAGEPFNALCALVRMRHCRASLGAFEATAVEHRTTLLSLMGAPVLEGLLGDCCLALMRVDRAVDHYRAAGNDEGLSRCGSLAVRLGRVEVVRALGSAHTGIGPEDPDGYRTFLRERALPGLRMGGDPDRGFWIDEPALGRIAAELGVTVEEAAAETLRGLRRAGIRQLAKCFVLSRLAGDGALTRELDTEMADRLAHPRAQLMAEVTAAVERAGGRIDGVLQAGDRDDFNPKVALIVGGELDGEPVVIKENLRLPIDFSRPGGHSAEAELLSELSIPHVVALRRVLAVGPHELMVLERAPGHVPPGAGATTVLPADEGLWIVRALSEVLAALHGRGIVYADIKASNVLYGPGSLTLVDFGMAQRLRPGRGHVDALLSTAAYVPPEMVRGFVATTASDVFQLGILLFELRTGAHPFAVVPFAQGDTERESELLSLALANLHNPPRLDAPGLTEPEQAVLRRMLAQEPSARPTASEVAQTLGGLARHGVAGG